MAKRRLQAADWAALIDQWRQSGLSLPAFCQRHGLSRGTMQNWVYKPALQRAVEEARRDARAAEPPRADRPLLSASAAPAFLPVRIAEATASAEAPDRTGVEIVLGAGRRIVLAAGFDTETLRRVVAVLEGRPC
jgi:hypothetical protein